MSTRSIKSLLGFVLLASAVAAQAAWDPRELAVLEITNQQRLFHGLSPLNADDRLRQAAYGHSQSMGIDNFFSHTTLAGSNLSTAGARVDAAGYNWTWVGENIAAGQGHNFNTVTEFDPISAARDVMFGTSNLGVISGFNINVLNGAAIVDWADVGAGWSETEWSAWGNYRGSLSGWMGSTDHRTNILNQVFTDLGVGYFWDPSDTLPILVDAGQPAIGNALHTYWTQNFAAGDTVVPLPAAFWLFASVLVAGLGLFRRRVR